MPSRTLRTVLTASITGLLVGVIAAPASAQTTGPQTFKGLVVTSGATGERQVLASPIVAKGVFTDGHLVEVDNLPGDPENVSRDDLVFRQGTFHLVSENVDVQFSLDPGTCRFTVDIQQVGTITGGTGAFTGASGSSTGSVHATGAAARNPDGSCNLDVAPLREQDVIAGSGTLTY